MNNYYKSGQDYPVPDKRKTGNGIAAVEMALFLSSFVIMSLMYGTPRLVSGGLTLAYVQEITVDCIFMAIGCLPAWWLNFRKLTHWSWKKRFFLHIGTAALYYLIWILLYQVYNPLDGKPRMDRQQMLQNIGPNLLFYVQVFNLLHIYHFFRERELQLKREKELSSLAYNGEINALKAQIQPHFLFNTLNSISASVPPQQESTRDLIVRLADTFRYALLSTRQDYVPLSSELDFIDTYLSLEKERFGERLRVYIDADKGIGNIHIPPMLLQPLVENALKHGIAPNLEGGAITISCKEKAGKISITISNTGRPYTGSLNDLFNGKGVGLVNTAKRLENLYGEFIAVTHMKHGGLSFSFNIPLQDTKEMLLQPVMAGQERLTTGHMA
jgi:two-component system LytT family sensor kinase